MTLPPRSETLPRTSRPPRFTIPAPSRRAATRALIAAAVILVFETVWWLPQPCDTNAVCAPIIGVLTGFALVPLVLAMIVWRVAGRASGVVIVTSLIVAIAAPILPSLFFGSGGNVIAILIGIVPLLLAFAGIGALPDLRPFLTERTFTIVVLILIAAWLASIGLLGVVIVPSLVAIAVAADVFQRRAVAAPPLPDED
ncbi:MAG: hypothetical protein ACJ77B_04310 [Chloroflexota bacterium]